MRQNASHQNRQVNDSGFDTVISENITKNLKKLGYQSLTNFQTQIFSHSNDNKNILSFGESSYGKSLALVLSLIQLTKNHQKALVIVDSDSQRENLLKDFQNIAYGEFKDSKLEKDESFQEHTILSKENLQDEKFNLQEAIEGVSVVFIDSLAKSEELIQIVSNLSSLNKECRWWIFSKEDISEKLQESFDFFNDIILVENLDKPEVVKPSLHIFHQQDETKPKPKTLLAALEHHHSDKYVVACEEENCLLLGKYLARYGYKVKMVSGYGQGPTVTKYLEKLEKGRINILICQRGLLKHQDLSGVENLVIYDAPDRAADYESISHFKQKAKGVDRTIITILSSRELSLISSVKYNYQVEFEQRSLPEEDEVIKSSSQRVIARLLKKAKATEVAQFKEMSKEILKNENALEIISFLMKNHFIQNFELSLDKGNNNNDAASGSKPEYRKRYSATSGGADATEEKPRFQSPKKPLSNPASVRTIEEEPSIVEPRVYEKELQEETREPRETSPDGIARIYISLGEADGFVDLADLVQHISQESKVDMGHFCGGGMIREQSSHIEVDEEVVDQIIEAMHNQKRQGASEKEDEASLIVCERAKQSFHNRSRFSRRSPRRRGSPPRK